MRIRRLWCVASLCIGCGGGAAPPAGSPAPGASADAPPTAKADAKPAGSGDGKPATADAPRSDAKPAAAADPKPTASADAKAAPPKDERLEDKKTEKATGVAGSYKTGVLSAAGLDPMEVGKSLNAVAPKLDGCYSSYLSKKPPPGLHTSYDVVVDGKGKTESAKLRADETKSADLHKCLETVLKAVAWPKPTEKVGKTTVEWTLGT